MLGLCFCNLKMEKKYISVDIEASGPTPGKYSMLSLGTCVVGNTNIQFYRELKPLNKNFILDAMRTGCLGLRCLDDKKHLLEYNPKSPEFKPELILAILEEKGEKPEKVMKEFADWIIKNTEGFRAVEAAAPIKFDGMFTSWYFDNFYGKNPFGHSGEDINSFYRGIKRDINVNIHELKIFSKNLSHNALQDAISHAKSFEKILEIIKEKF